jgi:uridine phosphorylase
MAIAASELIINPDGSVYHLGLKPGDVAKTIITVGDPDRVPKVSQYFDNITLKVHKRELVTHAGTLNGKEISVLSSGMGTDNIDIVMNELDALFNIDFQSKTVKDEITSLKIIRVGTSGCIDEDIEIDTVLVSKWALGYDGLLGFYRHAGNEWDEIVLPELGGMKGNINPASSFLLERLAEGIFKGVTYTAAGFYAPQGRQLRAQTNHEQLIHDLRAIRLPGNRKVTNIEMETAGLYGLGNLMGHEVISFSVLLAHRIKGTFSTNPEQSVDQLIRTVLERISTRL